MALGAGAGYFAGAKAAADNALAHRRIDEQAREFDMNAFQRERQMDMQDRQQRAANERADRAFAAQEEQRAIQNDRADRDFDFRREQQGLANERADRAFDFQREQFDAGQRRAGEEMDFRREQADRQNERQDWLDTWQGAKMQQDMEAQDLRLREANDLYEEARRLRADNDRQRQARESLSQSAHGMLVRSIVENGGHRPTDEAMQVFNQAMGTDYTGAVMGDGGEVMFLRRGQNPDGTENPFSVDPNTFISSDNVRMVMDAVYGAGGHGYGGGRPSRGASGSGSGDGMTPYQQGRLDLGNRRIDRQERNDWLADIRAEISDLSKERADPTTDDKRRGEIAERIKTLRDHQDKLRRGIDPYAEEEKPKDDAPEIDPRVVETEKYKGDLAAELEKMLQDKNVSDKAIEQFALDLKNNPNNDYWPKGIPLPTNKTNLKTTIQRLRGSSPSGGSASLNIHMPMVG